MLVSVIIPCRSSKENIEGLLKDLEAQEKHFDIEIIRIDGVSPPGKARNLGAKRAKGEIFVFLDCDIRLGYNLFLNNLTRPLLENKDIGGVCASIRVPPGSSDFQLRYAREVPHSESSIVDVLTEVQVASSACFAVRREVFFEVGGFNEDIPRGEDSVISYELRERNYSVLLVPYAWCYHPQPKNLRELIKTNFRNGLGSCFVDIFYPELNLDIHPEGVTYFSQKKTFFERVGRFILEIFKSILKMRILLFLSKIFYIFGYLYGFFKFKIFRCQSLKRS